MAAIEHVNVLNGPRTYYSDFFHFDEIRENPWAEARALTEL